MRQHIGFTLTMMVALAGATWAEAPVAGLGVLCVSANPTAKPTAGEAAARDLAVKSFGAREVKAEGTLALPADLKALWWHSESQPAPAVMRSATSQRALLDWLAAGHGLFLSGTALAYVTELGLEPTAPRPLFPGGNDQVAAGVTPGANSRHPAYAGFEAGQPVMLASAGYPATADFWGSGGPKSGAIIGEAVPDSQEHPFVEYAVGKGRVIALGWRLSCYGMTGNANRANLEHLTGNVLRYLAAGQWYGKIGDSRLNALWTRLDRVNADAVRRAVEDLTKTYPDRYKRGPEYLKLLDELVRVKADFQKDDAAADRAQALLTQLDQALLDNPLLDFDKLLLVARSEANLGLPANWDSNSSISAAGYDNELQMLSPVRPEGTLTTVYRPSGGRFIGDVDLDFSGDRVLFSMPNEQSRWRVYEMDLKTGKPAELPLIPDDDIDNYDACYLPDGNVIFTSTAPFIGVPCVTGSSHVSNSFRWDRAAGTIRELTFEQDHDWCPTVMNDGRVMYLRWEYTDLPHFVSRILFAMNPDGTGQMALYKSNSYWPNSMFYARPIPNDPAKFVAVVVGHHDGTRMGELVLFDAARGRYEADGAVQRIPGFGKKIEPVIRDGLTGGSWPKFLHPYPLSDKYFLVSCKPTPGSRWGLYLVDVFDNMTLIKESDTHALLEPLPLRATPRPPVIAPKVDLTRKDATVFVSDVYQGKGLAGVPRGTVKKLRLFTYQFAYHGMGGQVNRVGLDGPWDVKRIVGTVPVEADGSAYFHMPANTPISVQPLDEKGQALQLMRSWMTAMPGETLSCVGCHEQRSTVPPGAARRAKALALAPAEITPWYGPTRGFSFVREVQPVLDRQCIACHNGSAAAMKKGLPDFRNAPMVHPPGPDNGYQQGSIFSPSYLALKRFVRNATIESDMHLLMPGEFAADTTWLMQMLRKGHHGVQLSAEDWDRLTTWIDLNTPAHGTWHEIVGEAAVNHYRDRRKDVFKRYAGRDEDPEEVVASPPGHIASPPAPHPAGEGRTAYLTPRPTPPRGGGERPHQRPPPLPAGPSIRTRPRGGKRLTALSRERLTSATG